MLAEMARDVRLEALLDRQALRDCIDRYFRCVDRFDLPGLRAVFHPDARVRTYMIEGTGDEYAEFCIAHHSAGESFRRSFVTDFDCSVDGDAAEAVTGFLAMSKSRADGRTRLVAGRLRDRFARSGGTWKILAHEAEKDWGGYLSEDMGAD